VKTVAQRVLVRGMVTGVGFRYGTLRRAGMYNDLRGHVRNVDSRTVECVIQGAAADVDDMATWLRKGPPGARVLEYQATDIPVAPSRASFQVTY